MARRKAQHATNVESNENGVRVQQGSSPSNQRPWAQRDADAVGCLGVLGRLFFGLIGVLVGAGILFLTIYSAIREVATGGELASIDNGSDSLILFAGAGAALFAFGISQFEQVWSIGEDADFDARLWSRLTPRDRGRFRKLRDVAASRAASIFFGIGGIAYWVITVANLIASSQFGTHPLSRAIPPSIIAIILTIGFFRSYKALRVQAAVKADFASADAPKHIDQQTAWVSQNRWEASWSAPGTVGTIGAWFDVLISIFIVAGSLGGAYRALTLADNDWLIALGFCLVIFSIVGCSNTADALREARAIPRRKLLPDCTLVVERVQARPLILRGKLNFNHQLPPSATKRRWVARLRINGWLNSNHSELPEYTRVASQRITWLETTKIGEFYLKAHVTDPVPVARLQVLIELTGTGPAKRPLLFTFPEEVVFAVEYPVSGPVPKIATGPRETHAPHKLEHLLNEQQSKQSKL